MKLHSYLRTLLFTATSGLMLLLHSCRPEPLPIDVPQSEPRLVVASQVIPGSVMLVTLSKSFGALTFTDTNPGNDLLSQILVTRGRVTVSYNGRTDTLIRIAPGFYGTFTTPLIDNVTYVLQAYDSATGLSAEATTQMMPRVQIDSMWVETSLRTNGDTTPTRRLHLKFTDPAGEQQYMVNLYRNTDFIRNGVTNPGSVFNLGNTGDTRTLPLTDRLFDRNPHTEVINIDDYFKGDTLTCTLSAISHEYYTYLVQKARSERNGLGAIFGEPVNFTTNVRGGYGFFTAHWPASRILILND